MPEPSLLAEEIGAGIAPEILDEPDPAGNGMPGFKFQGVSFPTPQSLAHYIRLHFADCEPLVAPGKLAELAVWVDEFGLSLIAVLPTLQSRAQPWQSRLEVLRTTLDPDAPMPRIQANPGNLRLGTLRPGSTRSRKLIIRNVGAGWLSGTATFTQDTEGALAICDEDGDAGQQLVKINGNRTLLRVYANASGLEYGDTIETKVRIQAVNCTAVDVPVSFRVGHRLTRLVGIGTVAVALLVLGIWTLVYAFGNGGTQRTSGTAQIVQGTGTAHQRQSGAADTAEKPSAAPAPRSTTPPLTAARYPRVLAAGELKPFQDFLEQVLSLKNQALLNPLMEHYAQSVDFTMLGKIPKAAVQDSFRVHFMAWPNQRNRVSGPITVTEQAPGGPWLIKADIDYKYRNPRDRTEKNGRMAIRYTVVRTAARKFLIVGEHIGAPRGTDASLGWPPDNRHRGIPSQRPRAFQVPFRGSSPGNGSSGKPVRVAADRAAPGKPM